VIRFCLLLLAGGLAAQHSRVPIGSDLCKVALVASAVLIFKARSRFIGCLLLGYGLFMFAGQAVVAERMDPLFAGDSMLARVRIADFPVRRDATVSMVVEPVNDLRLPPRSRLTWFDPPVAPRLGDVWILELRLRRPRGSSNPGGFDLETWMFRQRLHASGYVVSGKRNRLLWSGDTGTVERLRAAFVARARAAADTDSAAAVLAAIGTGARHLVSPGQWRDYAATGTTHLMAISGLHVGLAAATAYVLAFAALGPLMRRGNHHLAAVQCGILAAAGYAVVADLGVPARRAVLMLFVAALALWRRRRPQPETAVALAAIVVYATDPIASLAAGFQLSFAAVMLLVWFARRRNSVSGTAWPASIAARVRHLVAMQSFLFLGLLPLTVGMFRRVAFYATPVNLVAVPVFTIVTVPLTLAGFVMLAVSADAADGLLKLAAASIDAVERVIAGAAKLPHADFTTAAATPPVWVGLGLLMLWAILPRGWPGRGIALLGLLAVVTIRPTPPPHSCFDAWILDVGQGLAVFVQTGRHSLLYDTGMVWRGGGSAAAQVIVPFLASRGLHRVDWLVVSHGDLDHAGGVPVLRAHARFGDVLAGQPLPDRSVPARPCVAGDGWQIDGVRFDVLHPDGHADFDGNNASCVLRVAAGDHALLLTGDIEADAERRLVEGDAALSARVVVVPHHGSRTSSSTPFVDSVSPDVAIVSSGFGNRWGFPRPEVVRRWQRAGAEVIETAEAGAVGIRLCAGDGPVRLSRERESRKRFWYEP